MTLFLKRVFATSAARIFSGAFGVFLGIFVARVFGPEGKGIVSYTLLVSSVIALVGTLGIANAVVYFLKKKLIDIKTISGITFWLSILSGMGLALISFLWSLRYPHFFSGAIPIQYFWIMLPTFPFVLFAIYFQNIFLAQDRMKEYNFVPLVSQVLTFIGGSALVLIFFKSVFALVVFMNIITIGGALYYIIAFLKRGEMGFRFRIPSLRLMAGYSLRLYFASIFAFLLLRVDLYLVNIFLGVRELGFYSIAANIADYLFLIPVVTGTILFPKVSESNKWDPYFTVRIFLMVACIMAFACLALLFLGQRLIPLVFGDAFFPAVKPLLFLLPGIFFFSPSIILMNHFSGRGRLKVVMWSPFIALAINLILDILYIPRYGISAAAISSSIAYSTMFIINSIYFWKDEGMTLSRFVSAGLSIVYRK